MKIRRTISLPELRDKVLNRFSDLMPAYTKDGFTDVTGLVRAVSRYCIALAKRYYLPDEQDVIGATFVRAVDCLHNKKQGK